MTTFTILGRVEPPWYSFDLEFEPQLSYRLEDVDLDLKATIAIKQSKIAVTCETNRFDDNTIGAILHYVYDWVSAEIDLFTFAAGMVLHFHLDQAIYPDGTDHKLIATAPDLAALATVCKVSGTDGRVHVDMRDVLGVVVTEPTLMLAMRDLSSSIRYGNNSLTNCGRVIDALRKAVWGKDEADDGERKQAWDKLRDAVRVSRDYLEVISNASTQPRHGSSAYIPGATRQEILRRTWTVMDRFLRYRLGGNKPLQDAEFPVL